MWTKVSQPATLMAVAGVSPRDVWAVGSAQTGSGHTPLTERWNGLAWKTWSKPNVDGELTSVTAISATNAWAVGYYTHPLQHPGPLIEHWNGRIWSLANAPNLGIGDQLHAAAALQGGHVWASGSALDGYGGILTVAKRLDRFEWRNLSPTNPTTSEGSLLSVSVVSPGDVWVVGSYVS